MVNIAPTVSTSDRRSKEQAGGKPAHPPKDKNAAECVWDQNVSTPDEVGVYKSDHEEPKHPPEPEDRAVDRLLSLDLAAYNKTLVPNSIENRPIIFRSKTTLVKMYAARLAPV